MNITHIPFRMSTGGITLLILFGASIGAKSMGDPALDEWRAFSEKPESRELIAWLRCQARAHIDGTGCSERMGVVTPEFFGKLGIFVTLKKGKKVRGCYGAFYHSSADIRLLLKDYLAGALTRDPRYKPLESSELDLIDILITIATPPNAVPDFGSIDPQRQGVVVTCDGGDSIVFVPAELRDISYLRNAVRGKSCQASTFNVVTLR